MSKKDKLFILRTYSSALNHLHQKANIVHGDIKPDNVLISRSANDRYVAKLIGFEESYLSKEPLNPDIIKSTEHYKSPELAAYIVTDPQKDTNRYRELRERLTCAVDVFASGIIFHEFWTGSMPRFEGMGTLDKAFYKTVIAREEYEYDSRVPDWLMSLIDDMVQRDPEKRPTMNEVFEAIKAEKYDKKNAWQNKGGEVAAVSVKPKIDYSRLKELLFSIPDNLDKLEPKTVVTKINMMKNYIQQNLSSMTQEQVSILTERLNMEIKCLKNPAEGWLK